MLQQGKMKVLIIIFAIVIIAVASVIASQYVVESYLSENAAKYKTAKMGTTSDGEFQYKILTDGTIEITRYLGSNQHVTIPSDIDGAKVTSIGPSAFYNCTGVLTVTIQDGVTMIRVGAFKDCTMLTRISMPDTITRIESSAFFGCNRISDIRIPAGVTSIEEYVFANCSYLSIIDIPESITEIRQKAFSRCSELVTFDVPESVTFIGDYAFEGCNGLAKVIIADLDNEISFGDYVFDLNVPPTIICDSRSSKVISYAKANGVPYEIDDWEPQISGIGKNPEEWTRGEVIISIDGANDVNDLPKRPYSFDGGVTWQEEGSRIYNENTDQFPILVRDKLGHVLEWFIEITNIDREAPKVKSVTGNPTEWVSSGVVLEVVEVEESASGLADEAYSFDGGENWQSSPKSKTFTKNQIVNVVIRDKAGNISEIEEVVIDKIEFEFEVLANNEIKITKYAGEQSEVTIPSTIDNKEVTGIGKEAFGETSQVTKITLPETMCDIHEEAFYKCSSLAEINIEGENANFISENGILFDSEKEGIMFYPAAKEGTEYIVPKSITYINPYAFGGSKNLRRIIILDNVDTIGHYAFANCEDLTIYCKTDSIAQQHAAEFETEDTYMGVDYVTDDKAPIFKVEKQEIYIWKEEYVDGNVKVIINDAYDSVVGMPEKAYSFDGGTNWQEDNTYICEENQNLDIKVRDKLGNIDGETLNINNIVKVKGIKAECVSSNYIYKSGESIKNGLLTVNLVCDYPHKDEANKRELEIEIREEDYIILNGENLTCIDNKVTIQYKNNTEIQTELEVQVEHKILEADCTNPERCEIEGCNYTKGEPLGHDFTYEANSDGRCPTKDYSFTVQCRRERCNETKEIVIIATGHDLEITEVEPTCTTSGSKTILCKICSYVEHAIYEPLGHSFTNYESDGNAKCTEDGTKTAKCDRCEVTDTIIDEGAAKGHDFKDCICTECGQESPRITVTSEEYEITRKYVNKIKDKTTVEDFMKNLRITNSAETKIYKDNREVTADEIVGTGMILVLKSEYETKTLTLVVSGDATGDGKVDFKDMVAVNRHMLNKRTLTGGFLIAGEVTKDDLVEFNDLVKLNLYRLKKIAQLFFDL